MSSVLLCKKGGEGEKIENPPLPSRVSRSTKTIPCITSELFTYSGGVHKHYFYMTGWVRMDTNIPRQLSSYSLQSQVAVEESI